MGSIVATIVCFVIAALLEVHSMSLFYRTPWVRELGEETVLEWFGLVAKGREEGPGSWYYIENLAIQNIACNQIDPLGPPCNANEPTNSLQDHGDYNLPYASVWFDELDAIAPFFPMFDKVYVGNLWSDNFDVDDFEANTVVAAEQADVARQFYDRYAGMADVNYGWYITMEGSLNEIATKPESYIDFLTKSQRALLEIEPTWDILWSPAWIDRYISYDPQGLVQLEEGLKTLFCGLETPIKVHPQDSLGQSAVFEFPLTYNYTNSLTCEDDAIPYHQLMFRVKEACPMLEEVKINMELFAERLNDGMRGENNGANIVNADPREINDRMDCYQRNNGEIGTCWAMPHWYYIWTFGNSTAWPWY